MYSYNQIQVGSFAKLILKVMRYQITFIALLFNALIIAQNEVKTYYDPIQKTKVKERYFVNSKNQKHGLYTKFDDRGLKAVEINFVNGRPHGIAKEYALPLIGYPGDEKVKKEATYVDGKLHGKISYYVYIKDGVENIKEGKKILQGEEFYENDKKIREIAYFLNGKKEVDAYLENGVQKKWYENGQLANEIHVENGSFNGPWKQWYTNGQIGVDGLMNKGKFFGEKKEYFVDGTLKSIENYALGDINGVIFEGVQKYYDSTGILMQECHFSPLENGIQTKKVIEYYSNGNKKEEYSEIISNRRAGNFKSTLTGKYASYFENGQLHEAGEINNKGNKEGVWVKFEISGEKIYESNFSNGYRAGEWIVFLDDNKIEVESKNNATYFRKITFSEKGALNNIPTIDYFVTGEIHFEGHLSDINPDILNGKCKFYYKNGQVQSEGEMSKGQRIGTWVEYHENGQIKVTCTYIEKPSNNYGNSPAQFIPNGTWIFYNSEGKKERKEVYNNGVLVKTEEFKIK
jgi:antitoxin component YwqK of YwqJK toxin-antitoxin module